MMKPTFAFVFVCALVACSKKKADEGKASSEKAAPAATAPAPAAAPAAGGAGGSCMNKSKSTCTDYLGEAPAAKDTCSAMEGTFAATPCAAENKLGTCTLEAMKKKLTYYPGGEDNLTAQLAQDDCKGMSGTWAP